VFRSSHLANIIARISGARSLKLRPGPGVCICCVEEKFESATTGASASWPSAIVVNCSALLYGQDQGYSISVKFLSGFFRNKGREAVKNKVSGEFGHNLAQVAHHRGKSKNRDCFITTTPSQSLI